MQVLTGQYPTLYTHKFRVFYYDFVAISSTFSKVKLFTLPKGYQVVFTMMKGNVLFAGGGVTDAAVVLHDSISLPTSHNLNGSYSAFNGINPIGQNRGVFKSAVSRIITISGTNRNIICNTLSPTDFYATLQLVNTGGLAALTAGSLDIWITVARFP